MVIIIVVMLSMKIMIIDICINYFLVIFIRTFKQIVDISNNVRQIYIAKQSNQYFTAIDHLWTGDMITTNKVIYINQFIYVIHQKIMQEKNHLKLND